MYRVSPLTYLVSGIVATGLHDRPVICAQNELSIMQPPAGTTCGSFLSKYASLAGGSIYNPDATRDCEYCAFSVADQFLSGSSISFGDRWRNYGIVFVYIGFNIVMAVLLYYLIRVRKGSGRTMAERLAPVTKLLGVGGKKGGEKEKEKKAEAEAVPVGAGNETAVKEEEKLVTEESAKKAVTP
jgi:ATP-binding cassette subfamily G (WHITE) protein 2 (PDR)